MTEDEGRDWLTHHFGSAKLTHLESFVAMLLAEADRQSLIARSTFDQIWARHIVDSAQLVAMAPDSGLWLDVGSGGGLPGIVVAILRDAPLTMVEPRRKRANFLRDASAELNLTKVDIVQANVQATDRFAAIVSARAVSNLTDLFQWTRQIASRETLFLLPRGENAVTDMAVVQRAWQGAFHVKQSITDPAAGIVVATGVQPR